MSFERHLIQAVRKQPVLYDRKHPQYTNKPDVERAWMEVTSEVGEHFDSINEKHCKLRWRSLRDRYVKQIGKDGIRTPEAKKWIYTTQLDFIADHLQKRRCDTSNKNKSKQNEQISHSPNRRTYSFIETSNTTDTECSTTLQFLTENDQEYQEYDEIDPEGEHEIQHQISEHSEPKHHPQQQQQHQEYDEMEYSIADVLEDAAGEKNQIENLCLAISNMIQVQLKKDSEKGPNEAYFKVLDSYLLKLPEHEMDKVKVEILNLVLSKFEREEKKPKEQIIEEIN